MSWSVPKANRGYSRPGREKVSLGLDVSTVADMREEEGEDLKESLEIGRESQVAEDPECANKWPSFTSTITDPGAAAATAAAFKTDVLEFWDACKDLHMEVMRAIALGLGIDENWFDSYTDRGDNTLRLLHYPSVRKDVFQKKKGQVRAGAHSDYGSITLLFQDSRGGLQVQGLDGGWIDAHPIEGTIVINAGDLLMRWSNDVVKSTVHRVVEPPLRKQDSTEPHNGEPTAIAVPWYRQWHAGLEQGSRLYFGENDVESMLTVLEPLHAMINVGPETPQEVSFINAFGQDLNRAHDLCQQWRQDGDIGHINQAWDIYYTVFTRIARKFSYGDNPERYPARYSIAYFCNPNFDRMIEVIPGTIETGEAKKYEGVNSGQYLIHRLTATY